MKSRKIQGGFLGKETLKQIEWTIEFFKEFEEFFEKDINLTPELLEKIKDFVAQFNIFNKSKKLEIDSYKNSYKKKITHSFSKLVNYTSSSKKSKLELLRDDYFKYLFELLNMFDIEFLEPDLQFKIKKLKKAIEHIRNINNSKNDLNIKSYPIFKNELSKKNERERLIKLILNFQAEVPKYTDDEAVDEAVDEAEDEAEDKAEDKAEVPIDSELELKLVQEKWNKLYFSIKSGQQGNFTLDNVTGAHAFKNTYKKPKSIKELKELRKNDTKDSRKY
jgi:hypothetical protein